MCSAIKFNPLKFGFCRYFKCTLPCHWKVIIFMFVGLKIQCQYCMKMIHRASLKRHIQNQHSSNLQANCQFCNKTYKNQESLKDHLRLKHGMYKQTWCFDWAANISCKLILWIACRWQVSVPLLWSISSPQQFTKTYLNPAWENWAYSVWLVQRCVQTPEQSQWPY